MANIIGMPIINRTAKRGYFVIELCGMSDADLYAKNTDEKDIFSLVSEYVTNTDQPVAFDLTCSNFRGADVVGILLSAYEIKRCIVHVASVSERLPRDIERYRVGDFIKIYKSIEDLPDITSSQSGQAVPTGLPAGHGDYSPR